jgi:hypothetical protein
MQVTVIPKMILVPKVLGELDRDAPCPHHRKRQDERDQLRAAIQPDRHLVVVLDKPVCPAPNQLPHASYCAVHTCNPAGRTATAAPPESAAYTRSDAVRQRLRVPGDDGHVQ